MDPSKREWLYPDKGFPILSFPAFPFQPLSSLLTFCKIADMFRTSGPRMKDAK